VPGIEKQWWHPFVHKIHKHVFALRPEPGGEWTVFEPWWTRLVTATISSEQARKFLRWGAEGDVLLVRDSIPGDSSQVRGWMNCAALTVHLLGRPYWVWTPHQLYRRLLRGGRAHGRRVPGVLVGGAETARSRQAVPHDVRAGAMRATAGVVAALTAGKQLPLCPRSHSLSVICSRSLAA
jgi:hypothetical protein